MAALESRRVANQPTLTKSQADWEQLRRALLMIVAQFKATDPDGCYTVDVRVIPRDALKAPIHS
jgi:hypothetical protein